MSNAGKRNWEPPEDQDPGSKRRAVGPSYAGAPPGPGLPSRPTGRSVGHSAPLASSSKEWNPLALKELTRGLRAFSLLDYDTHSGSYSIHPLVQEWIRDISPDAATVRECAAWVQALCVNTWGHNSEDYAIRRRLLPHLLTLDSDHTQLVPELANSLHWVYFEAGYAKEEGHSWKSPCKPAGTLSVTSIPSPSTACEP